MHRRRAALASPAEMLKALDGELQGAAEDGLTTRPSENGSDASTSPVSAGGSPAASEADAAEPGPAAKPLLTREALRARLRTAIGKPVQPAGQVQIEQQAAAAADTMEERSFEENLPDASPLASTSWHAPPSQTPSGSLGNQPLPSAADDTTSSSGVEAGFPATDLASLAPAAAPSGQHPPLAGEERSEDQPGGLQLQVPGRRSRAGMLPALAALPGSISRSQQPVSLQQLRPGSSLGQGQLRQDTASRQEQRAPAAASAVSAAVGAAAHSAGPGPVVAHWLAAAVSRHPLLHDARLGTGTHAIQRQLLMLRMPPLTERFAADMPVRVADDQGRPYLLVLPSDRPCTRQAALASEAFLASLLRDPARAGARAAAWRQQVLLDSCSSALLSLTSDYHPLQHAATLRQQAIDHAEHAPWFLSAAQGGLGGGSNGGPVGPASGSGVSRTMVEGVWSTSASSKGGRGGGGGGGSSAALPPLRTASRLGDRQLAPPPQPQSQPQARPLARPGSGLGMYVPLTEQQQQQLGAAVPLARAVQAAAAPGLAIGGGVAGSGDLTWDTFCASSVTAALTACFAEAVHQVEVGCAERGRLLAQLWNTYTSTLGALLEQQKEHPSAGRGRLLVTSREVLLRVQAAEAARVGEANAGLLAETAKLRWENSTLDFLRREITRLRKDVESLQIELDECRQERAVLQAETDGAEEELEALRQHLSRRLAVLRWRHAAAVVGTRSRQGQLQSGGLEGTGAEAPQGEEGRSRAGLLLAQVAALERAAAATVAAQQRRRQWRLHRQAERMVQEALGEQMAAAPAAQEHEQQLQTQPVAVPLKPVWSASRPLSRLAHSSGGAGSDTHHAAHWPAPDSGAAAGAAQASNAGSTNTRDGASTNSRSSSGGSQGLASLPGSTAATLLGTLTPEAKALLLLSLNREQRQRLLAAMPDEERAGVVVALDPPSQQQVLALLGPKAVRATEAAIYSQPRVAARWLAAMAPDKAAAQFCDQLSEVQQSALVLALPPLAAAQLLVLVQPEPRRGALLAGLPPEHCAALLVAVPPPAALALLSAGATDGGWLLQVLQCLPARQRSDLLAGCDPGTLSRLLRLPGMDKCAKWVLSLLPRGARAAAELEMEERAAAATGEEQRAAAVAALGIDPSLALLAHFESLPAAAKTTVLSLGPAATAAPLLAALPSTELAEVLLLLPSGRAAQLVAALPPAAAQRVDPVLRSAAAVRGSLLVIAQHADATRSSILEQTGAGAGSTLGADAHDAGAGVGEGGQPAAGTEDRPRRRASRKSSAAGIPPSAPRRLSALVLAHSAGSQQPKPLRTI